MAFVEPSLERDTLIEIYEATGGLCWLNGTNWLSDAPINQWDGVITDSRGRVTGLYLSHNQLSGEIPSVLGRLGNLEMLSLDFNELQGSIPADLGYINNLKSLHLSHNQLEGLIPPALGHLGSLEVLDLSFNPLKGPIPSALGYL